MKKSVTTKDILKKLKKDSEYQSLKRNKEKEHKEFSQALAEDEKQLVTEIRKLGYKIKSVYDLVNNAPHRFLKRNFIGPYPKAYPVLVNHLSIKHHANIREGIIRALTVKDAKDIAAKPLLEEFYKEKNINLKWVIANALETMLSWRERQKYPEIKEVLSNINL